MDVKKVGHGLGYWLHFRWLCHLLVFPSVFVGGNELGDFSSDRLNLFVFEVGVDDFVYIVGEGHREPDIFIYTCIHDNIIKSAA